MCDAPLEVQLMYHDSINKAKQDIFNIYILMSIWVSPFVDLCLLDFTVGSFFFAVKLLTIDNSTDIDNGNTLARLALWLMIMSLLTYFIRSVQTKFFVSQVEAE